MEVLDKANRKIMAVFYTIVSPKTTTDYTKSDSITRGVVIPHQENASSTAAIICNSR